MAKKTKILRIINRLNIGGPTFNAAYLTKYLPDTYETVLIGGAKLESEASSEFILEQLGVNYVLLQEMERSINPFNDYKVYKKLREIIRKENPDIVHTHASKAGTLGRLAAFHEKVPVVVHTFHGHVFHSYFGRLKTELYKTIERYLAKSSSRVIAISEIQKNELVHDYRIMADSKAAIVPLGFDLSRFTENQNELRNAFRKQYQLAENEVAIAIVGRLVPIKNHELFISAIKETLKSTSVKIRAFIVGDGELKQDLKDSCDQKNIPFSEDNKPATIQFTSWVKDVERVYAGVDFVVMSSLNEGTPVSLIEAQAAGKPVVSTNVGGVEDIVRVNQSAILTESNNLQELQKAILKLVEDKALRDSMQGLAKNNVLSKFSIERLTKDIDQLYQELLTVNK